MESIIIYGLKDPRDGQTYYIGKTHQPDIRFRQHLRGGENGDKDDWLDDLSNEGLMPEMETLEVVRAGADEHERESFWITFGLATGWPLTNRVIPAAQTIPGIRPEGTKQIRLQLDDELRRLVKVTAAQRGESIKEAGGRLFRWYVDGTDEDLLAACEHTAGKPSEAIEIMRREGFVIDNLDEPWQKFAFTLYTMLVGNATQAQAAIDKAEGEAEEE